MPELELEISSEVVEAPVAPTQVRAAAHGADASSLEIDANEILPMVGTADVALKLATALKEASAGLRAPLRERVRPLLAVRFVRHDDVSKNDPGYMPLQTLLHNWGRAQRAREGLTMSARISALTRPWVPDSGAVNSGADGARMWMTEDDRECWMRDKHDPKTMCLKRVLGLPDPDEGVLLGYVPVPVPVPQQQSPCDSVPARSVSASAKEADLAGLKDPSPDAVVLTDAPSLLQAERLCVADVSKLLAASPPGRFDNIGDVEAWMREHGVRITTPADIEPLVAALRKHVADTLAELERAKAVAAKTPEPKVKLDPKAPAQPATHDAAATFARLSEWVQEFLVDAKPPAVETSKDAPAPVGGSTEASAPRKEAEPVSDVMDLYRSPGAVGDVRVVQQRGSRRWYRFGSDRTWQMELRPPTWDEGLAARAVADQARAAAATAGDELAAAKGRLAANLKSSGEARARYGLPQPRAAAATATVSKGLRDGDEPDQSEVNDYLSFVDWSTTGDGTKPRPVEADAASPDPQKSDRAILADKVAKALGVELTTRGAAYVSDNLQYYNDDTALTASVTAQSRRMLAAQAALETQANWQKLSAEAKAATREKTRQRVAQTKASMMQQHAEKSACVAAALLALLAVLGFTEHVRLPEEFDAPWAQGTTEAMQAELALVLRASALSSGADTKAAWTDILSDKSDMQARWEQREPAAQRNKKRPTTGSEALQSTPPAQSVSASSASACPTAPTLLAMRDRAEEAAASTKDAKGPLRFANPATVHLPEPMPAPAEVDTRADDHDEASKEVVVLLSQLGSERAKQWGEVLSQASRTTVARFAQRDVMGMIASIAWGTRPESVRVVEAISRVRDEKHKRALVERCRSVLKDHPLDWRRCIVQLLGDVKLDATPQIRNVKVVLANHFTDGLLKRHNIESIDEEDLQHSKEAARQLRDHATILKQEAMDAEVRAALGVLKKEGYAGWRQEIDDLALEDEAPDPDLAAAASVLEGDVEEAGPQRDDAMEDDEDADKGADDSDGF